VSYRLRRAGTASGEPAEAPRTRALGRLLLVGVVAEGGHADEDVGFRSAADASEGIALQILSLDAELQVADPTLVVLPPEPRGHFIDRLRVAQTGSAEGIAARVVELRRAVAISGATDVVIGRA